MDKVLSLDVYASAGVGVLALLLGFYFTRKIPFLKRFCIPAPVSGGLLISLITLLLFSVFGVECRFDGTVKDLCMMLFFTSVGFQCDVTVLKKGGKPLLVMIGLVAVLIIMQNFISVGIAKGLHLDPVFGMSAGSIPMSGGHGTAGGFSPLLEQMGLEGASSITMAAATFGLVAGSLLGGPLGEALIRLNNLSGQSGSSDVMGGVETTESREEVSVTEETTFRGYLRAACVLLLAMANMSAVCYKYRYSVKPFIIVPIIGAMFVDLINTGVVTVFLNLVR